MEVIFSKNTSELESLLNKKGLNSYWDVELKRVISIDFERTYFLLEEKSLVAFKVKAYSVIRRNFLIETPSGLKWIDLKYKRFYKSKDDFYKQLTSNSIHCLCVCLSDFVFNGEIGNLFKRSHSSYRLFNSYVWEKDSTKPKVGMSKIYEILQTKDSFVIYYELDKGAYDSYEECVKARLDGFEIQEFGEEQISVNIEIKREQKPKIHTLRFIEE